MPKFFLLFKASLLMGVIGLSASGPTFGMELGEFGPDSSHQHLCRLFSLPPHEPLLPQVGPGLLPECETCEAFLRSTPAHITVSGAKEEWNKALRKHQQEREKKTMKPMSQRSAHNSSLLHHRAVMIVGFKSHSIEGELPCQMCIGFFQACREAPPQGPFLPSSGQMLKVEAVAPCAFALPAPACAAIAPAPVGGTNEGIPPTRSCWSGWGVWLL